MDSIRMLERVNADPEFARDLAARAAAAAPINPRGNTGGHEWSALLDAIAESDEERERMTAALNKRPANSPEALARMTAKVSAGSHVAGAPTTTTTTTTITTTSCLTLLTEIECLDVLTITLSA